MDSPVNRITQQNLREITEHHVAEIINQCLRRKGHYVRRMIIISILWRRKNGSVGYTFILYLYTYLIDHYQEK